MEDSMEVLVDGIFKETDVVEVMVIAKTIMEETFF